LAPIWGPLGLPDSPFFALPRLLSAAVWGEDPDLTPPRPPAYAEDGGDLCYVKDCGRAIALLMLAERLNHGTYNISTGRLVRNSEVVAAINAVVPGANITLPPHRTGVAARDQAPGALASAPKQHCGGVFVLA